MSRSRKFSSRNNGNGAIANGTNGASHANGAATSSVHKLHIPEVVDTSSVPAGQLTLRESGHFPTLRNRLLDGLNTHKTRQEDAVDRILKVSAAETEYLESRASQQEQQYKETLQLHEKLGV